VTASEIKLKYKCLRLLHFSFSPESIECCFWSGRSSGLLFCWCLPVC